jgi:ATP-dependent exoDNAse (exonuclease V) beta subunit
LQLSASPQINVAIATLQYLVSEEDKLAKLAIVHYLTQQHNLLLEDYIQYVQNETLFQQLLTDFNIKINRKKLTQLPLFTSLNEIFSIYTFPVGNPFLMRLLDEAENFSTQRGGAVSQFLEWWEEKGQSATLSTPQDIEAVTVSTIHKSKGLEYPVVILPFSKYLTKPTKPDIFLQDDEHITGLEYDWVTLTDKGTPERFHYKYEEESGKTLTDNLNMLYVAHTRAGRELHIITANEGVRGGNYSKFLGEWDEREVLSEKWEKGRKGEGRKHHHII